MTGKYLLTACCCFLSFVEISGQACLVRGVVTDSSEKQFLVNSVIYALQAGDSILSGFSRTDERGFFQIRNLNPGRYILLISYPGYAAYQDDIQLTDSVMDIGRINLFTKFHILQDVVVRQTIGAIRIKGDTTEYKADSFHLRPNASIEELLKKLPGIQVDKKGKITAQGETVKRVLVDGEEFFSDDPTLVTQNLRSAIVDKVQVFNEKTEQQKIVGSPGQGQSDKTINFQLKKDKARGNFGKIKLSQGDQHIHDDAIIYNNFYDKRKFSLYGIASNIFTSVLNSQGIESFSNELNIASTSNLSPLDTWNGNYESIGYPNLKSAGLHYNDKWDGEKQSFNGNYQISRLNVNGFTNTFSEEYLPTRVLASKETYHFNNSILQNKLNATYEFSLDAQSTLKFGIKAQLYSKETAGSYEEELTDLQQKLNDGLRTITALNKGGILNTNITWLRKFNKPRRTLLANVTATFRHNNANGYVYSKNNFFGANSSPAFSELTDQFKTTNNKEQVINTKLTYTEPVTSNGFAVLSYGFKALTNASLNETFDNAGNGKYTIHDSNYSAHSTFNIIIHEPGIGYTIVKQKYYFISTLDLSVTSFYQKDLFHQSAANRNFINVVPQTTFSYGFTNQKRLTLAYKGITIQPSLQQIQPLNSNIDPMNIMIGNALIKPSFVNTGSLKFSNYNTAQNRSLVMRMSSSFTKNAISDNEVIDTSGKHIFQAVNLSGISTQTAFAEYTFKLKKSEIEMEATSSFSYNSWFKLVNSKKIPSSLFNAVLSISAQKGKENKYDAGIHTTYSYFSGYAFSMNQNKEYWQLEAGPNIDITLLSKFHITSDCNFIYRNGSNLAINKTAVVLNVSLSRTFFKNENFILNVSGNDLFNEDTGFNAIFDRNIYSQTKFSKLQRYFMLSAVWNFTRTIKK